MKKRSVIPEILDGLTSDDPRAIRSRRDLRLINWLMGNYRWLSQRIGETEQNEPYAWVEIGAGDGALSSALPLSASKRHQVSGLDFAPRPESWPEDWNWEQGDVFETLGSLDCPDRSEGLVANLFLHHFERPALLKLGDLVRNRFSRIVVSEPARYRAFTVLGYLLFPFVNDVTRHDVQVSIGAGFRRGELSTALGLGPEWKCRESVTLLGAYRFEAWRK